jgi:putative addiction module antidote
MQTLKLITIGNSTGVILPTEVMAKLRVEEGDYIFLTETSDGYRLIPYSSEFEAQMGAARKIMRKRRSALRELAK